MNRERESTKQGLNVTFLSSDFLIYTCKFFETIFGTIGYFTQRKKKIATNILCEEQRHFLLTKVEYFFTNLENKKIIKRPRTPLSESNCVRAMMCNVKLYLDKQCDTDRSEF